MTDWQYLLHLDHLLACAGYYGPMYRCEAKFDESKHSRADDGKFGEGTGEPAKENSETRDSLDPKLRELPNPTPGWMNRGKSDAKERTRQLEEFDYDNHPEARGSIAAYADSDSHEIRQAEIEGDKDGQFANDVRVINAAIAAALKTSKPVMQYRGMSLSPNEAKSLMSAKSFNLKAISSFTASVKQAMDFSAGKSLGEGKQDESRIPVVIYGKLKSFAIEGRHSDEVESLVPGRNLKIVSTSSFVHPKYGTTLVLEVK